jgi:hypothetical protein
MRHTHASLLIHEGVHPKRMSERLGHSSIKLTKDTYGHLFDGADQESAAKMEKLFGPVQKVVRITARKASWAQTLTHWRRAGTTLFVVATTLINIWSPDWLRVAPSVSGARDCDPTLTIRQPFVNGTDQFRPARFAEVSNIDWLHLIGPSL